MAFPGETIASGAPATCEDCNVTPNLGVYQSGAGYYVGTYCNCGPYSRESGYYATHAKVKKALYGGEFGRSTDYNVEGANQLTVTKFDWEVE